MLPVSQPIPRQWGCHIHPSLHWKWDSAFCWFLSFGRAALNYHNVGYVSVFRCQLPFPDQRKRFFLLNRIRNPGRHDHGRFDWGVVAEDAWLFIRVWVDGGASLIVVKLGREKAGRCLTWVWSCTISDGQNIWLVSCLAASSSTYLLTSFSLHLAWKLQFFWYFAQGLVVSFYVLIINLV